MCVCMCVCHTPDGCGLPEVLNELGSLDHLSVVLARGGSQLTHHTTPGLRDTHTHTHTWHTHTHVTQCLLCSLHVKMWVLPCALVCGVPGYRATVLPGLRGRDEGMVGRSGSLSRVRARVCVCVWVCVGVCVTRTSLGAGGASITASRTALVYLSSVPKHTCTHTHTHTHTSSLTCRITLYGPKSAKKCEDSAEKLAES